MSKIMLTGDRHTAARTLQALALAGTVWPIMAIGQHDYAANAGPKPTRRPPAPRKCLNPPCVNSTTHNGGYCSAECCKPHRSKR